MIKFILILLSISFVLTSNIDVTYEEDVAVLNDQNFQKFIDSYDHVLVEFYAPWCGHCKDLAPSYSLAAGKLKSNDPVIPLAKVDATENKMLSDKYDVQGYPTLIFFTKGQQIPFSGTRDAEGIITWVNKKIGPLTIELKSVEGFEKFKTDNQVVVILFGNSIKSHEYKVFESLAQLSEVSTVKYAYTLNSDVRKAAGITHEKPQLTVFKHFDEQRNDFDGEFVVTKIYDQFLEQHIYPTILDFTESGAEKIFRHSSDALFLFVSNNQQSKEATIALEETKNQIKDKIQISRAEIDSDMGSKFGEFLGLKASDMPKLLVVDFKGDDFLKFFSDYENINTESIIKFVDDYKAGKLKPYFLSEELPEENDEAVVTLVGKNFEEIVFDEEKDVLVEFYAPSCGHCQQLAPIYQKVAEQLKQQEKNIILAKIDYTKNEARGIEIEQFPTLKFFPAGPSKQSIDYQGGRSEDDIIKFINKNRQSKQQARAESKKDDL